MSAHQPFLKDQVAAALDWWREAGVDCDFADDATDWLAEPEPVAEEMPKAVSSARAEEPKRPELPAIADLLGANPPQDLAAFREFWRSESKIALAGNAPRLMPRGEVGAKLMVLVATPEAEDREQLLSGPQGRLLSKILAAMQLQDDEVYFASAVPQALPLADGQDLLRAGFARVLAHHVALVGPTRILAFGTNILPLLGHDAAQQTDSVQEYASQGEAVPLLVTEGLDALASMPRLKARFWRRWLAHRAG
ncbi:uracil-DNA glycosylase family protein [Altererythrobacter sp. GH1-8]|uniref:uracil-DNA glycosylase family protein n=1 Tax=Altererythrobacter sp. GH1-8 TaxID=3349333 RepID=UPI00374DF702